MRTSGSINIPIRERRGIFGSQYVRVVYFFTPRIIDKVSYLQEVELNFSKKAIVSISMNTTIFSTHHFDLSPEELEKFEKFLTVFIEYNSHTNLSAIRDEEGIIEKHFVDSLYGASIIGEIVGESSSRNIKLLDIGSG